MCFRIFSIADIHKNFKTHFSFFVTFYNSFGFLHKLSDFFVYELHNFTLPL